MRILIAEDEPVSRRLLAAALDRMGHEVVQTCDGREAWEVLQHENISMVIADWMMSEMDGVELVRRIRAQESDHYIYVILLTSRSAKCDVVLGLDAGADDYITKPFEREELVVRIKGGERVIELERQLAEKNRQLAALAMVDGLTGISNRRALDDALKLFSEQATRYRRFFSLAMIDIDFFKRYNDCFGHAAGDHVLRSVAQILAKTGRQSDLVFRYGGEEFVALFPEADAAGALTAAERMRRAVVDAGIPHPDNPSKGVVTVSIGLSTKTPASTMTSAELLRLADVALFNAKREGRDRVCSAASGRLPTGTGEFDGSASIVTVGADSAEDTP
ncbi:MAG: diguanylate cyclase [Vicinamibacterales bacterium]